VTLLLCTDCHHPVIHHDDIDGCDEMIDTEDDSIAICKCRMKASEQADDAQISEIRSLHRGERISTVFNAPEYCPRCIVRWPCDTALVLARLDALTAEIDRERYHVGNMNICIKNFTAKCDQLQRQVETATRSVDDWREAWEQKQIELEQAESERDALRARAERAESERDVYRDALTLIARGVWTARNSVESIVWGAREALKKGAALAAASEGEGATDA
jgi:hypothetical protein